MVDLACNNKPYNYHLVASDLGETMNKQYLGDEVYVEFDDRYYEVTLTTENGIEITNTIVLEAEVLNNLNEDLKRMFAMNQMSRKEQ